jgi:L-asparagine oxygenase
MTKPRRSSQRDPAKALRSALDRKGWAVTQIARTNDLLALAESLGEITPSWSGGPVVDELRPKSESEAAPHSLSGMHGLGAFPYHTDAAHHILPPRFVLLRLASRTPTSRRTLLAPIPGRLPQRDRDVLEHDVWLVDGGRGRFLTSILARPEGGADDLIRFDEGCMRPADREFGAGRETILRLLENRERAVTWSPTKTLVLDNWRTLHAREDAVTVNEDRVLERVLVRQ